MADNTQNDIKPTLTRRAFHAFIHWGVVILHWPFRMVWRGLCVVAALLGRVPALARFGKLVSDKTFVFRQQIDHHVTAWRIAWNEAKREEPVKVPQGKELEFLPAVIEIQETPPSPAGRAVAVTLIAVFALALVWSIFGKIDIIAVAQGKIVPGGRSKVIQPLESGVIKAIHVRDGQRVKRGEPLIEIDTTAGADRERFLNEYYAAQIEVARLRALIADKDSFESPKGVNPAIVQAERDRLRDQLTEYRSLRKQAEAYRELLDKQYVPRLQYLEVERKRAEKMNEYTAALSAAETRAKSLSKEISKAGTRADQQYLAAPIDGVVQQLAVHTVGGVVTPAQQLMVIAPEEGSLEVEAILENKDIGFVNEEQLAEVKVDAFPFTRYGTLEGAVVSLSRDAVQIDKVGLVYTARVNLARSTINIENKEVRLSPGMTVSVEIKTGKRRIIEYFLSPLIQAAHNSIRER
jgi:hemolysin D